MNEKQKEKKAKCTCRWHKKRYRTDPEFRRKKIEYAKMRSKEVTERAKIIRQLSAEELLALVRGEEIDTRRI